ncbi:MAG: type II secretion system protein [Bdellovibrionaceae bacterium]|jgi:prepilin-type N-terminal cleavage/methylation domain-containing protein|nr:type II secretion system protein [Pseudobdellovibrionaceae bacterium]
MNMKNNKGFTLIEIIMVILLVGILAAAAVTQFLNFQAEAKDASVQASLSALRAGINNQYAQMQLRCGATGSAFPAMADIAANDITTGGSTCVAGDITNVGERKFITGAVPANAWGGVSTITACVGGGCTARTNPCNNVARVLGWCYDVSTGEIWADSALSGNNEYSF